MIKRILLSTLQEVSDTKINFIPGPRQVGKTTLLKELTKNDDRKNLLWLNADEPDIREILTNITSTQLQQIIGSKKIVVIDEAQRITNIGLTLKLLIDNIKGVKVFVTGSSALELADTINEPLTGRKNDYFLFPLSYGELEAENGEMEERRLLETRLIYGFYPEVVTSPGNEKEVLKRLSDAYLYKDLLSLEKIKKPSVLVKLLQALALQLGSEVSYNEIAQLIGVDNETISRYIDLLEKSWIVFSLPSLSRNVRNEIKKGRKIYFFDNGIRNALIANFLPLSLRQDTGALWENFLVSERRKCNQYNRKWVNTYFWRTQSQQEIDYIEEDSGSLSAFEFKWNARKKANFPKTFLEAYPNSQSKVITPDNFRQFVL
jgi:uncharacterized protein